MGSLTSMGWITFSLLWTLISFIGKENVLHASNAGCYGHRHVQENMDLECENEEMEYINEANEKEEGLIPRETQPCLPVVFYCSKLFQRFIKAEPWAEQKNINPKRTLYWSKKSTGPDLKRFLPFSTIIRQ